MKRIALIMALLLIFSGCSSAKGTFPDLEFELSECFSNEPYMLLSSSEVCDNKVVYYINYRNHAENAVESNVLIKDLVFEKETEENIFCSGKSYIYKNNIYYQNAYSMESKSLESGEEKELFITGTNPTGFSYGGEGYLIYWDANEDYSDIKIYSYNIENEKSKLIAETNYITDAFHSYKIRNKQICFAEKTDKTYTIYSADVKTGRKEMLLKDISFAPKQMVYNGETLIFTDNNKLHIIRDGFDEILLDSTNTDCDILGNRYVFYFNEQLFVYDLLENKNVYSTEIDLKDHHITQWMSLDTENLTAVLTTRNYAVSNVVYPEWEYDSDSEFITEPDLVYILKMKEK